MDGELLVSGFEQKESETWEAATRGFVYNVAKEEYVLRGINQPHSLRGDPAGGTLWNCESAENRLISRDGRVQGFPSTYTCAASLSAKCDIRGLEQEAPVLEERGKIRTLHEQ